MSAPLLLLFGLGSGVPIELAVTNDDYVTLGGQSFPITGFTTGNAISEFETGIKVGKVSYDQREHAYFLVLDDFSGGFGHRRLDIRDELGTFWDSDADNSPDLARPGHITLPPAQDSLTVANLGITANPSASSMGIKTPTMPLMAKRTGSPKFWLLGWGGGIYSSTGGDAWTRRHDASDVATVASIVEYNAWDGGATSRKFFAFFVSDDESLSGNARYVSSSAGTTWSNGAANRVYEDGYVWDGKLLGAHDGQIHYAVYDQTGTSTEIWNVDDPAALSTQPITTIPKGQIRFIGTAEAPWGEPAVYFTDGFKLYVLDFSRKTHHEVGLGLDRPIIWSGMWNAEIVLTDGWNVFVYNPAGQTFRNIGFPITNKMAPSMHGTSGQYRITAMAPADAYLYATVVSPEDSVTRLFRYNGLGWSQLGASMAIYSEFLGLCTFPPHVMHPSTRRIIIPGAASATSTTLEIHDFLLPTLHHVPSVGTNDFGDSGANWTTGWIDGGFNDINGTLLRLNIDAFNLSTTSTVTVEYQLDNDESSSWTQMVDANGAADIFDSATSVLYFSGSTPKRGIEFRTVRFRITLNRDASADTDSPELRALVLVYTKEPPLRTAWTFTIDINRMIERSTTGNDTTFYIDGSPATLARVWSKLKSLWNTNTLLPLIIPNVEPSPGINVKITDMPLTFDDFRDAIDGKGTITLQVLEPVASS